MGQQSTAQLQHDFLRAFFATLCVRGETSIAWGSPQTDMSFRRLSDFLLERAENGTPLKKLASALRPDPISGIVTAIGESINYLQPGIVSVPNPSYRRIKLVATERLAETLKQQLPPDISDVLDGAVCAFQNAQSEESGNAYGSDAGSVQAS